MDTAPPLLGNVRYELLPFGSAEREAAAASRPLTLTVTCSPRQGMDAAVDVACRLRAMGHAVVLHLAARMVRDRVHLDDLLESMAEGGIADVFLVGGDAKEPVGEYGSALDLIAELRAHERAPRSIGVPCYPEGHPLIEANRLGEMLRQKACFADYMVSQICFDPKTLVRWLEVTRATDVELPLFAGVPGVVDRRRLLEISVRVGVGASVRFVRKQRGLRRPFSPSRDAVERVSLDLAPLVGTELGIAGLHFFTFNQLADTVRLVDRRLGGPAAQPARRASA